VGIGAFENRLEQMISGLFARAFRSAVQPVEIAAALQREVDNNAKIMSRDRRLVPNDFAVELSPVDLERLADYDSAMATELTRQLKAHAQEQSYVFPGPVSIGFEAADDLTTGRFRVRSRALARVSGGDHPDVVRRARAVLEVNGTQHRLDPPGLIVGRGVDADVRINDPGVSRKHVFFEVTELPESDASGRDLDQSDHDLDVSPPTLKITIRDLGSTNGMLVDGQRINEAVAGAGTWVKVGNTTLTVRMVDDLD
jgi:hypothetical protein